MLTGDNGLIGKSVDAKKATEISEGKEQLEIAVNQSFNKRGNIDEAKLAKNLSKINGIKYINSEKEEVDITENTEIELTAKVKLKGYNYKINDEGNVSYKKEGAIDNEDIMANPLSYYGKYVTNYNSLSNTGIVDTDGQLGKWQIFLADDTNIYLIASNQIHKDYKPLDYNNNRGNGLYFNNILNLYDTSNSINPSVESLLGKLSKQDEYHEWLSKATLLNNNNQKAILSMLDTDKWNEYIDGSNNKRGFKNTTYAEYVMGGPTLEMFCNSYNTTHGGKDIYPKPKDDNNVYFQYGYKILKEDSEEITDSINGLKDSSQTELVSGINNMYFKCNLWLASPHANTVYPGKIMSASGGRIGPEFISNWDVCFRPLVCLKSDVHLVEKNNGTTATYELELD